MSQPKNWPSTLPYLKAPLHSKDLTESQLAAIRTRPSPASAAAATIPTMAAHETPTPCPRVRIQPILAASHPARGQSGLFAARHLAPGSFILAYLGRVHGGGTTDAASDYDLWLDRDAGVAVDAARQGGEARFVNDFRGVAARANAEFRPVFCERWGGQMCVGVWVLPARRDGGGGGGKGGAAGIRKGEEILVSYGKGFWSERRKEMDRDG